MTHSAEPTDEMLQCFDEAGNPTEVQSRKEVKTEPFRWWCGVATVWLVNDAGEMMVSRRSSTVSANPGKWQSYFGGHVEPGRSFLETVRGELAEEAGLECPPEAFYWVASVRNDAKKVHGERYAVRFNGSPEDLRFIDGEVSEARWMNIEEQWAEKEAHPEIWCNGCPPELQEKIRAWVKSIV
jgi:isopentenyldiphosphate isomerase